MPKPKTWRDKLANDNSLPKTCQVTGKMRQNWGAGGTGTMVVPAPREVDALMKKVPRGKLVTIAELRAALAKKHGVNFACPITTGIRWIAAHAAQEAAAGGAKRITPYWRTLKTGGEINAKYPGGLEAIRRKLQAEGHETIVKGKRVLVKDYEKRLVTPEAA